MATETWRPIAGYEGRYEVSDLGRVRSLARIQANGHAWRGRVLKAPPNEHGYLIVGLHLDGNVRTRYVHRLVLEAFVGLAPDGQEALHRDGSPANNALSNLCWGTRSANVTDQVRHGTHKNSSKTHCPSGHAYDGDNLYVRPGVNHRMCRECQRAHGQARTQRRRARAEEQQTRKAA